MYSIRSATTRLSLAYATTLCLLCSGAASAITFNQPGYAQSIVATIPGSLSSSYGGVVEGPDNNIYLVGSGSPDAFRVTPAGAVTTLTLGASNTVLGVGIVGNTLYVGQNDGRIDTFDISLPAPTATFLTTIGGSLNGNGNADFALAPAGFGAFGGQLIASNGGVYAVHPVTGAKTDIFVGSGDHYSSLDFGPNGTLYVADEEANQVITVTAAGATSVFANLSGSPDGLAVHPVTGDIYVTYSESSQIFKITPAGVVSTFATDAALDGGYWPAGFAFSSDGSTLYYLTDEGGAFKLAAITGFATAVAVTVTQVPALSITSLFMLALLIAVAGAIVSRRKLS